MNAGRIAARLALTAAFIMAIAIPVAAIVIRGEDKPETWMLAAAALAVATSIVSAWSTRRALEFQEDAQRPSVYPAFDLASRYGLALIKVKNSGPTPAYNISINWNTDLLDYDGKTVGFPKKPDGAPAIAVLMAGESIVQTIGVHHAFLKSHPDTEYTGSIHFADAQGKKYKRQFRLDGRQYAGTLMYDEEGLRTHYELQKIPKELDSIRKTLERVGRIDPINTLIRGAGTNEGGR